MRRTAITISVVAAVAGSLLGVATGLVGELPGDLAFVAKLGVPWCAAAFALGAWTRRPDSGAGAGVLALISATITYYTFLLAQGEYGRSPIGVWWILIAVPAGVLFGAAGGAWRDATGTVRSLAVGLLLGALVGEGVFFLIRGGAPSLAIAELVIAAVLPVAMLSGRRDRMAAVAAAAVLALVGAVAVPLAWRTVEAVRHAAHEFTKVSTPGD